MYSQIYNQLFSLNNSTYLNKINNIKFHKQIKIKKYNLDTFIYNILQHNTFKSVNFTYNSNSKYYDTNITKNVKHYINFNKYNTYANSDESDTLTLNDNNNINIIMFLEDIFKFDKLNNFSSKKNINSDTDSQLSNNKSTVEYYNSTIVNINNIEDWYIIDEDKTRLLDTEKTLINNIKKLGNSYTNYSMSNYISLELMFDNIIVNIIFSKSDKKYIDVIISFDMNVKIKSNMVKSNIDKVINLLKVIDTSIQVI